MATYPFRVNASRVNFFQSFALLLGQLMRKRDLDLAGKLRVFPLLPLLHMVPKLIAVMRPVGGSLRSHDRREQNPLRARRVVFLLARLLVLQPLAGRCAAAAIALCPLPRLITFALR